MSKFCMYCGKELPDNAMFCSGCGKKADLSSVEPENHTQGTHQNSEDIIDALKTCKSIFAPVQQKYDSRNQLQVSLSSKTNYFILFVVFIVIGFVLGNALDYTFWEMGIQTLGVMSCWIGIGLVVPLLITLKIKSNERNQAAMLVNLNSELEANYQTKNLPVKLAFEYSDPRIIDVLIDILKKGRADTIKEAINCMLDDQYKAEALRLQKEAKSSADATALLALGIFLRMNKK